VFLIQLSIHQNSSSDIVDIFILVYKTTIGFSLLMAFTKTKILLIISNEKSYYLIEYDCKSSVTFAEKSY
jgi:hypothetical protein